MAKSQRTRWCAALPYCTDVHLPRNLHWPETLYGLPAQQRVTCGKQHHKTHRAGLRLRVLTHMIAYIWQ